MTLVIIINSYVTSPPPRGWRERTARTNPPVIYSNLNPSRWRFDSGRIRPRQSTTRRCFKMLFPRGGNPVRARFVFMGRAHTTARSIFKSRIGFERDRIGGCFFGSPALKTGIHRLFQRAGNVKSFWANVSGDFSWGFEKTARIDRRVSKRGRHISKATRLYSSKMPFKWHQLAVLKFTDLTLDVMSSKIRFLNINQSIRILADVT